jgi:hypothetical protein
MTTPRARLTMAPILTYSYLVTKSADMGLLFTGCTSCIVDKQQMFLKGKTHTHLQKKIKNSKN